MDLRVILCKQQALYVFATFFSGRVGQRFHFSLVKAVKVDKVLARIRIRYKPHICYDICIRFYTGRFHDENKQNVKFSPQLLQPMDKSLLFLHLASKISYSWPVSIRKKILSFGLIMSSSITIMYGLLPLLFFSFCFIAA